jgi:hypothetical protein
VNNRTALPGADRMLTEAIDRVSAVSGLRFEVEGVSDEVPSQDRKSYQPDRYGDRWAPVLVAWTDDKEYPELGGDVVGRGGSDWSVTQDNTLAYVSGIVALDGPDLKRLVNNESAGWEKARASVMHEFGHLLGLDHVDAPSQIMNPEGNDVTEFQSGDKAGLAQLGEGKCYSEL